MQKSITLLSPHHTTHKSLAWTKAFRPQDKLPSTKPRPFLYHMKVFYNASVFSCSSFIISISHSSAASLKMIPLFSGVEIISSSSRLGRTRRRLGIQVSKPTHYEAFSPWCTFELFFYLFIYLSLILQSRLTVRIHILPQCDLKLFGTVKSLFCGGVQGFPSLSMPLIHEIDERSQIAESPICPFLQASAFCSHAGRVILIIPHLGASSATLFCF